VSFRVAVDTLSTVFVTDKSVLGAITLFTVGSSVPGFVGSSVFTGVVTSVLETVPWFVIGATVLAPTLT
jgi:hypothetical protein